MIFQQSATSVGALVADFIRGVWIFQAEALFNIHVLDTDAQSYCHCTLMAVLSTAKRYKKQKYSQARQDHRATFTPLCVIVDGMLGCEATAILKWIGDMLSAKFEVD